MTRLTTLCKTRGWCIKITPSLHHTKKHTICIHSQMPHHQTVEFQDDKLQTSYTPEQNKCAEVLQSVTLFNIINGPATIPDQAGLIQQMEVGSLKVLGPTPYKKVRIAVADKKKFEMALVISALTGQRQRVVTGDFASHEGVSVYNMITGQPRRCNIPIQHLFDSDQTVSDLIDLLDAISFNECVIPSGQCHCLIGLDGKLNGKSGLFQIADLQTFLGDAFVVECSEICSVNPEYVKYGNRGQYREPAASVTFLMTVENVDKIIKWGKHSGQIRIGFECNGNFTNVEFRAM